MSKNTNLSFLTDYITADITNGRIGINNASPTYSFDVTGIARTSTSTYLATASGNVGIGTTTLSAWISTAKALQINNTASLFAPSSEAILGNNVFVDSTDNNKYITTNFASMYRQVDGKHLFYSAASGTAGNTISFGTPKLTIASTGSATFSSNLTANNKIDVIRVGSSVTTLGQSRYLDLSDYYGNTDARMEIGLGYSAATGITNIPAVIGFIQMSTANYTNGDIYFATRSVTTDTAPTERMRITSAGGLNINTSTTGYTLNAIRSTSTAFNTSYRGGGAFAMEIMARFIEGSTGRGVAIGYSDSNALSGIFATQSGFGLHIWNGSAFKLKITMNSNTVGLDIPTSSSGLSAGDLYNDGSYVRMV
jgi:hypothetical protein